MGTRYNRLSEAVITSTHDLCFDKNKKNVIFFHLKNTIFTAVKYCSIMHGHVCLMVRISDRARYDL